MQKSFLVTELLCVFLGCIGAHRYYTGYIGLGILQTLTLGGLGIWALIDLIFISTNKYKDAKGLELADYNKNVGLGILAFILTLFLLNNFGPKKKTTYNVNIHENNYDNQNVEVTTNINKANEKKVKFRKATCTITSNSYRCFGELSDFDKIEIKKLQNDLK